MTDAILKLFGHTVPRNRVEVEKHELSKWADSMTNVDADARKLLVETISQCERTIDEPRTRPAVGSIGRQQ